MPSEFSFMQYPLAITFGFVAPLLISYLKDMKWHTSAKSMLSFLVCVAFGFATAWMSVGLTLDNLNESVGTVFIIANLFYNLYFKDTRTNHQLEDASPFPSPPPPPPPPPNAPIVGGVDKPADV